MTHVHSERAQDAIIMSKYHKDELRDAIALFRNLVKYREEQRHQINCYLIAAREERRRVQDR